MSRFLLNVVNKLPGEGKKVPPEPPPSSSNLQEDKSSILTQGKTDTLGKETAQGSKTTQGKNSARIRLSAQGNKTAQGSSTAPRTQTALGQHKASDLVAPQKDYMKAANSIVRIALSTGLFRGKSKQLYDYLYSKTRGAITPSVSAQLSRAEIMKGSHIGSTHTLRDNLKHLRTVGLVKWEEKPGQQEGNEYYVYLPEEIFSDYPGQSISPGQLTSSDHPGQNLPGPPRAESALPAQSVTSGNQSVSSSSKTSLKTNDDDDTHTLQGFVRQVIDGAKDVCGGKFTNTQQERERWDELANVLINELKKAANNTDAVSSAPAFFAAHLRRSFAKNENKPKQQVTSKADDQTPADSPPPPAHHEKQSKGSADSKFSFEERRRYAQNQSPPLGNGWMVESASGKYDELVGEWLDAQSSSAKTVPQDNAASAVACPDCHGAGMYYPDGFDKGAAKCRHEKLIK